MLKRVKWVRNSSNINTGAWLLQVAVGDLQDTTTTYYAVFDGNHGEYCEYGCRGSRAYTPSPSLGPIPEGYRPGVVVEHLTLPPTFSNWDNVPDAAHQLLVDLIPMLRGLMDVRRAEQDA